MMCRVMGRWRFGRVMRHGGWRGDVDEGGRMGGGNKTVLGW